MKVRTILNIGVSAMFLVVVTTVTMLAVRGGAAVSLKQLPVLGEVPDFSLTEASGDPVTRSDLREKVWVASFIFTRCAEACPSMMRRETKLQQQLPPRDDVKFVSFSVDPEYDTPTVLAKYATSFGVDRSRWWFATGEKKQIYHVAIDGFRLSTVDVDPAQEMPILHSSKLVLVDRHGAIRGYYDTGDDGEMQQLVKDVRRVLAERS